MCGIVAILDRRNAPVPPETIERMTAALAHRGPDGSGTFHHRHAALGHTLLSIVGAGEGAQPMHTPDGRHVIVYNGEIYNFAALRAELESQGAQFRTHTDTEVVAAAYARWGRDCLDKLRGMFAFVVLDLQTCEIFAARDRIGIKPLFWHDAGRYCIFASEMKAIFASGLVPCEIDPLSVHDLLRFGHTVAPHTLFKNVQELPPGCYVEADDGRSRVSRYWSMPVPSDADDAPVDEKAAAEEFAARFKDTVASHLIGDVPIACYLSGGIDSNSVACMLRDLAFPVARTYSMTFDVPAFDERAEIEHAAEALGMDNRIVEMNPDTLRNYGDVIYHLEQPQWWTLDAALFHLAAAVRADGIKVSLSGQGSDELLAGYHVFRFDALRRRYRRFPRSLVRRPAMTALLKQAGNPQDLIDFMLRVDGLPIREIEGRFGLWPARLTEWHVLGEQADAFLTPSAAALAGEAARRQQAWFQQEIAPNVAGRDPLSRMLYLESRMRLPALVLWKEDRMNMAHGVEARPPFVDHEFFTYAATLPKSLKLRGVEDKYILRRAMRGRLHARRAAQPKRPFFAPVRHWLHAKQNHDWLRETLSDARLSQTGVFAPHAIAEAVSMITNEPPALPSDLRSMRADWAVMLSLGVQMLAERMNAPDGDRPRSSRAAQRSDAVGGPNAVPRVAS